jgi:hypothetical protein
MYPCIDIRVKDAIGLVCIDVGERSNRSVSVVSVRSFLVGAPSLHLGAFSSVVPKINTLIVKLIPLYWLSTVYSQIIFQNSFYSVTIRSCAELHELNLILPMIFAKLLRNFS